jgi:alanine-glyoxylate transaminase/(R)-3-amino-2-methylpropionate-pyruvate transaminase
VKELQFEKPDEETAATGSRRNAEAGFMQQKSQEILGKQKRFLACRCRTLFEKTYPERDLVCTRDMGELIRKAASRQLAAVIAEPMNGEGGFIAPLKEYYPIVAKIIRKYGGVWIGDEVRIDLGRTGGTWFGLDHWGVQPNVITNAKGLADGLPAGDTRATPELADSLEGLTISTIGGHLRSARTAKATIGPLESEPLWGNARFTGRYLRERRRSCRKSTSASERSAGWASC